MARQSRASSLRSVFGDGLDLESTGQLRACRCTRHRSTRQRGQRASACRIDEQSADLAQRVIAGRSRDGQRWLERLVDGQDLLDDDPRVAAR